ncbi:MAG: hypothetical protein M1819_006029 [Sarea resinae]|nr:MAG: hypothetical protein M1819_006029 [Sarea resinae]
MSAFYFGGSDSSSDQDEDNLPYPTPLARSAFLTPDFSPTAFLSTLHNRHQTLEDLRSELRSRSQLLSKELLDLVNTNYQDFLTLGGSLQGGEEKVEEVRVGLLGFRREVEGVRRKIEERGKLVSELLDERTAVRKQIAVGRTILEFESRLAELEERLMVQSNGAVKPIPDEDDESSFSESDEDESEEEYPTNANGTSFTSTIKLARLVQQYLYVKHLSERVPPEHPFVIAQESRVQRVKNTLLLDLGTALKEAMGMTGSDGGRLMKVMGLYAQMDESGEAVQILKVTKS